LEEREAKPLGKVRLRPNRGFPGCPAQDVTPSIGSKAIEEDGTRQGILRFAFVQPQGVQGFEAMRATMEKSRRPKKQHEDVCRQTSSSNALILQMCNAKYYTLANAPPGEEHIVRRQTILKAPRVNE
jgi:hypothetical protein